MRLVNWIAAEISGTVVRLGAREHGQGMAEYGLILALVAVVVVGAVTLLGTNIQTTLTSIAGSI